jgi:uncharacterized repeat protein (TIGR04052 family)
MFAKLPALPPIALFVLLASPAAAQPGLACVGDANGDGKVTVDEVLLSVNNVLTGCGLVPITLQFQARVGDEPFACGHQYEGVGLSGSSIIPADFRLYVHNVRLVNRVGDEVPLALDQDGRWQYQDIALLDFEDKTPPCNQGNAPMNSTVRGLAPAQEYTGVRFTLGVPFRLNHENAAIAPSPLNITSLFWSWQAGYKFLRIDEALDSVRVHLGSTGCEYGEGNHIASCRRPNRGEVYLHGFDPTSGTIVVDLAALLANSDLEVNQPDTPPGCMSDPDDDDCGPLLQNLGVNFANGLPDPSRQTFFRVR